MRLTPTGLLTILPLAPLIGPAPGAAQSAQPVDPLLLESIQWYTGVAGSVDEARAHKLLVEAASDRDVLSRMWIARVLSRGRMGFPEDRAHATALADSLLPDVRRLAEVGVAEAVFLMGTAFDEGLGVEEDPSQAALWHRRAAEAGHVLAQHNLGNQYAAGRGVARDPAQAVRWWMPAGTAGDAVVQLRLGEAFEAGLGVEPDRATALRWYRDAARRGNRAARQAVERLSGG